MRINLFTPPWAWQLNLGGLERGVRRASKSWRGASWTRISGAPDSGREGSAEHSWPTIESGRLQLSGA